MTSEKGLEIPLLVKLCADKAAYEVKVQRKIAFNMEKVRELLEAGKSQIIVYTPFLIIFTSGTAEVTLSQDGRMLIKKVSNPTEAKQVAQKILQSTLPAVKP